VILFGVKFIFLRGGISGVELRLRFFKLQGGSRLENLYKINQPEGKRESGVDFRGGRKRGLDF
jgi:hypothetical protein